MKKYANLKKYIDIIHIIQKDSLVHKEKRKKSFRYMDCMLLGHKLCDKRKKFWL